MAPAERGRFFAVCCTTEIPKEVLDIFLDETFNYTTDIAGATRHLVVIRDLAEQYTEATQPPTESQPSPPPFQGNDPLECARKVRQNVEEASSDINYEWLLVLDERFLVDSSVLLVCAPTDSGTFESVRLEPKIAELVISARSIGFGYIGEDQEIVAQSEDGVLRF